MEFTVPRIKFTSTTKAKAVVEVLREQRTANQIAKQFGVHPVQLSTWKTHALRLLPSLFDRPLSESSDKQQVLVDELYRQIGELQVQLSFLKKKL
jgi:transposase-like protein